ncbi:MAG: hypothetical protein JXA54_03190 [Candidatus Heimdallarchaeota archaeon]|nr:hypothetical protein [Candidatus Heimdallarchaeota archaeon]
MTHRDTEKELANELRKSNQIIVPAIPEMIDATTKLGKGEIEVPKEIKEIEALIFSRGRLNAQFFRGKTKLYVVPSWVLRMLSIDSIGVISLGHSSSFINSNYRNWVAFGGLDCQSEGIVTDKGLIVPQINGYGILLGAIIDNKSYYCSNEGTNKQSLVEGCIPIIKNDWIISNNKFQQVVFGGKSSSSEIGVVQFTKMDDKNSNIVLSIRPFNQEGVTLIHTINYRPKDQAIIINKELALKVIQKPEKIAIANYSQQGDSAMNVISLAGDIKGNDEISTTCTVGLANLTLIFPKEIKLVEAYFRMTKGNLQPPPIRENIETQWKEKLSQGLSLLTHDKEVDRLFKASLSNLLLLVDPGTITPGPTEYHRFWCRDAAYLISALDRAGYHVYAREALNQFINRQRDDGFFYSHEGEFDSNGEGIWVLSEHAKLTHDLNWLESVYEPIEKAAEWLISARNLEKKGVPKGNENLVKGLLPPGFSAEHLGSCDYFYWDNFWGVTGLREAAFIARLLRKESAGKLKKEYEMYLLDLYASISKLYEKYNFLPVGPFRECDSAMIANLCAYHPTRLWDSTNEILMKTAKTIYDKFTFKGGVFHEVAWNCYGTYLTMHLAQVFHEANDQEKVSENINWLIKNQTCSMGWAEGISPQTMQGGMGDSPHGWASADWIHLLRNLFCVEGLDGSVKLLSGMPVKYLSKGVSASKLITHFGNIDFTAKLIKNTLTIKLNHNLTSPTIKIMTPKSIVKINVDKGEALVVDDQCVGINNQAKVAKIELE